MNGMNGLNDGKNEKESKMMEVERLSEEVRTLSFEILDGMRNKKEIYFGDRPEKIAEEKRGYSGVDSGFFNKVQLNINIIKENLNEINRIISLF